METRFLGSWLWFLMKKVLDIFFGEIYGILVGFLDGLCVGKIVEKNSWFTWVILVDDGSMLGWLMGIGRNILKMVGGLGAKKNDESSVTSGVCQLSYLQERSSLHGSSATCPALSRLVLPFFSFLHSLPSSAYPTPLSAKCSLLHDTPKNLKKHVSSPRHWTSGPISGSAPQPP